MSSWLQNKLHNFSCEHYTELCSRSMEVPLTPVQKVKFWLHHVVCTFCRRSRRQFSLIEKACHRIDDEEITGDAVLSDVAKQRLRNALEQHDQV